MTGLEIISAAKHSSAPLGISISILITKNCLFTLLNYNTALYKRQTKAKQSKKENGFTYVSFKSLKMHSSFPRLPLGVKYFYIFCKNVPFKWNTDSEMSLLLRGKTDRWRSERKNVKLFNLQLRQFCYLM